MNYPILQRASLSLTLAKKPFSMKHWTKITSPVLQHNSSWMESVLFNLVLLNANRVWAPASSNSQILQHGGSILGSVIFCRKVPTISQFLDFVRCIVFDLISFCVTPHTLYNIGQLTKCDAALLSFRYTSNNNNNG